MIERVDILVVGAGPAGSLAAKAAALAGAKVLLVEAKRRIGMLPHCAEFIPQAFALELDISNFIRIQAIQGMEIHLVNMPTLSLPGPGWIIDRQIFDFSLAAAAANSGTIVWTSSRLLGRANGCWLVRRNNKLVKIQARAVVIADGAFSSTANFLGLPQLRTLFGIQLVVPLSKALTHCLIFLRPEFKGGYAWLFPRGLVGNLGIGCEAVARPWRLIEILHNELLKQGIILPGLLGKSTGLIPRDGLRSRLWIDNSFIAGDAAGLTHPLSGAGIPQAVFSGAEAGAAAVSFASGAGHTASEAYANTLFMRYNRYLARGLVARIRWENEWQHSDFIALMITTWPGLINYIKDKGISYER